MPFKSQAQRRKFAELLVKGKISATRNGAVSDATMRCVRAALSDEQVVELAGAIAGYNMVSRFVVATGIDPE